MEIKGVFFDLYGTLLEYGDMDAAWGAWFDALRGVLCDGGVPIDRDALTRECEGLFAEPEPPPTAAHLTLYERRLEVLCGRLNLSADPALLRAAAAATVSAWSEYVWLDPQAKPVLDALGERMQLALISNFDHPPHVRHVLEETGLAPYFDPIVISAEAGVKKPDPAIMHVALDATGLEAYQAVYIGDTAEDMQAAHAAGMRGVWIERGADAIKAGAYYERSAEGAVGDTATPEKDASIVIGELNELAGLFGLLVPKRLDGVHLGGPDGGVDAEDRADESGDAEGEDG